MALTHNIQLNDSDRGLLHGKGKTSGGHTETITPAGDGYQTEVVATSTGESTFTVSTDISGGNGVGRLELVNESTTNGEDIDIGFATSVYYITLDAASSTAADIVAGTRASLPLKSGTNVLYIKAAAGTPKLRITVYER